MVTSRPILLMSRSVPPAISGTASIVGNLAQQFSRDEMVIVGYRELGRPPADWSPDYPRLRYAGVFSTHRRGEEWRRRLQIPVLLLVAVWTAIVSRCKVIVVVYPSPYFLLVGYLVSRITGKPLIAYFHNTFLDNRPNSAFARWLQQRVFRHARRVLVMSEGMQQFFRERYPDLDTIPLQHSFNEPLEPYAPLSSLHNPVRLCFAGSVNTTCADALSRMAAVINRREDVAVTLFTSNTADYLATVGFTENDRVRFASVPYTVVRRNLKEADILLLPHGFVSKFSDEEIRTIFPTKLIEYLASGRPILAHLPADSFLCDFLRRHECALVVNVPAEAAVEEALDQLIGDEGLRNRLSKNALAAAQMFYAPIVADKLRKIIHESLADE
ncbi:MAG: glycosyltransferase [Chloroflexi bacterium]|nr:glycosyltransferase [Chloroflexota bacterium]